MGQNPCLVWPQRDAIELMMGVDGLSRGQIYGTGSESAADGVLEKGRMLVNARASRPPTPIASRDPPRSLFTCLVTPASDPLVRHKLCVCARTPPPPRGVAEELRGAAAEVLGERGEAVRGRVAPQRRGRRLPRRHEALSPCEDQGAPASPLCMSDARSRCDRIGVGADPPANPALSATLMRRRWRRWFPHWC